MELECYLSHEIILGSIELAMVSPSAQVMSQSQVVLVACEALNYFASLDLVGKDALAVQIDLAPKEEELLTHF